MDTHSGGGTCIAVAFYLPEVSGAGFRNGIQRTVGHNERYSKGSRQRVQLKNEFRGEKYAVSVGSNAELRQSRSEFK